MITDQLINLLRQSLADSVKCGDLDVRPDDAEIVLELPRNKEFGDYACNLAMSLARQAGKKPRAVAECLISHIQDCIK